MTLPKNILFDSQLAVWLRKRTERRPVDLSPREREVAELIAQGLQPHEMAARLGISDKTVTTYRMRIRAKLGCRDDLGIVQYVCSSAEHK